MPAATVIAAMICGLAGSAAYAARQTLRAAVYKTDPCLARIVDREDPSWDPTRWNTSGSGAYGLPQAQPAWKMASAGRDWRTNPWTQLRWARSYAAARYGGTCGAWAAWQRQGWW